MTPEALMARCAASSSQLDAVRSGGTPEWNWTDACLACAGLPDQYFSAFAFRYALNDSVHEKYRGYLSVWISDTALREHWPLRIEGRTFLADLVSLALFEEWAQTRAPKLYQQLCVAELWPVLLGVSETTWKRHLRSKYEAIRQTIESWCGTAHSHAAKRIHEDIDALQEVA